jgi:hypothetical protein
LKNYGLTEDYFVGVEDGKTVNIKWDIVSEYNLKKVYVEKSENNSKVKIT